MFAKRDGILIAVEAMLFKLCFTPLWWSKFGLFFIQCSFGYVLHKKSKTAFLAIFFYGGGTWHIDPPSDYPDKNRSSTYHSVLQDTTEWDGPSDEPQVWHDKDPSMLKGPERREYA
jgi:hypothetical protein